MNFFAFVFVVADAVVKQKREISIINLIENDILALMVIGQLIFDKGHYPLGLVDLIFIKNNDHMASFSTWEPIASII